MALEADFARRMIEAADPDFSIHGDIHQAPIVPGGSWICELGKTVCFNAGQSHAGEDLHYIELDWRASGDWTALWHGDGQVLMAGAQKNRKSPSPSTESGLVDGNR
jgi:hypothetical protein